jgi:hypothetical protein
MLSTDPGHPLLSPHLCPACGYSWQGLPHRRCPECGETVGDDEVVLVGVAVGKHPQDDDAPSVRSLAVQSVVLWIGMVGCCLFLKGRTWEIFFFAAATSPVVISIFWLKRYFNLRRGVPTRVLRLSAAGFRYGSGATIGRVRPWADGLRITLSWRKGLLRLRGTRYAGRIPLLTVFHHQCVGTPEMAALLAATLVAWVGPRSTVIYKESGQPPQ